MYRTEGVLALLALYVGLTHSFSWDVVVAGEKQLEFYDNNGTRSHTEKIPSHTITSLAYDPVHNSVLFAGNIAYNFSISSFNIATREIIFLYRSVQYTFGHVEIAYDPATQLLFWSEAGIGSRRSIFSKPAYTNTMEPNLLIKVDRYESTDNIAVDSCGRYIYWTMSSKIERARFDGSEREVVIDEEVYSRGGITIDHRTQKMYWLDVILYYGNTNHKSIESADLNGKKRKILYYIKQNDIEAHGLIVSKDFIYWRRCDSFLQLTRNTPQDTEVEPKQFLLAQFSYSLGMATNYKIEDQNCEAQKSMLPINAKTNDNVSINISTGVSLLCVHGTKVKWESRCECTQGYIGERCEVSVCHNYCFQGDCSVSAEGQPKCRCNAGYSGERCEVSVCQNYCFQGDCSASAEGQLMCRCKAGYSGERCEVNACLGYCSNKGVCSLNEESEPVCKCTGHYKGERCNVSVCQNYCFQGDCSTSAEGHVMCRCKAGYSGERCEVNACHEYCSNNGVCSLNEESEPVCQCTGGYEGERCDVPVFLDNCLKTVSLLRDILNKDVSNTGYSGQKSEVDVCFNCCLKNGACSERAQDEKPLKSLLSPLLQPLRTTQ